MHTRAYQQVDDLVVRFACGVMERGRSLGVLRADQVLCVGTEGKEDLDHVRKAAFRRPEQRRPAPRHAPRHARARTHTSASQTRRCAGASRLAARACGGTGVLNAAGTSRLRSSVAFARDSRCGAVRRCVHALCVRCAEQLVHELGVKAIKGILQHADAVSALRG
jgi:hypothetical protein